MIERAFKELMLVFSETFQLCSFDKYLVAKSLAQSIIILLF